MRIIQSFWSKPSLKTDNLNSSDRGKGGWSEKKFNYMSWALSCLQFRKFYNKVELYTDEYGYDLLIKKLNLPYSNVEIVLDEINTYHEDLWAIGKIHTYSCQSTPFIHADGDVYIWNRLPHQLEQGNLIAQNLEAGYQFYEAHYQTLIDKLSYFPSELVNSKNRNAGVICANAGILGGNNIRFLQEYCNKAFDFVNRNLSSLDNINIGVFNMFFEQFLFYALAEKHEITIDCLLENVNHAFDGIAEFTDIPKKKQFIHVIGFYKRQKAIGEQLAYTLHRYHPQHYYRIVDLLKSNQI